MIESGSRDEAELLAKMIGEWRQFVDSVATGYRFCIYDYTNDLSARDIIDELLEKKVAVRPEQLDILAAADEYFKQSTDESPLLLVFAPTEKMWWYGRIPKMLYDPLLTDLREL